MDCRRSINEENKHDWPVVRLLNLIFAYFRVSKPALLLLLEKNGMNRKCLENLIDLHKCMEYKVRDKEDMIDAWMPAKELRKACSTSPILFNVYSQAVIR